MRNKSHLERLAETADEVSASAFALREHILATPFPDPIIRELLQEMAEAAWTSTSVITKVLVALHYRENPR